MRHPLVRTYAIGFATLALSLPAWASIEAPIAVPGVRLPVRHAVPHKSGAKHTSSAPQNHGATAVSQSRAHHQNQPATRHASGNATAYPGTGSSTKSAHGQSHGTTSHKSWTANSYLVPPPPPYTPSINGDAEAYSNAGAISSDYPPPQPAQSGKVARYKKSKGKQRRSESSDVNSLTGTDYKNRKVKSGSFKHHTLSSIAKGFKFFWHHITPHKHSQNY